MNKILCSSGAIIGKVNNNDYSSSDVESAKKTVGTTLYELNVGYIEEVKNSPFFWIERTAKSTVPDTLARVEKHLGLSV